jgi:septal ring factor EnvC (AmiA/AmiB activator)
VQLKLQSDLATTQEVAMKLDKQNKLTKEECSRLRSEFKCQEDDREYLIKQNLLVKRENEALRGQVEKMRGQLEVLLAERNALMQQAANLDAQVRLAALSTGEPSCSCCTCI